MIPAIPHILPLQTIFVSMEIPSSLLWLQRWSAPIPHRCLPPRLSPSGVHILSWSCWRHRLLIQWRWCCQSGLDRSWYGDLLSWRKWRSQWCRLRRHHRGNWLGSWDGRRRWWWCSHLLHHLHHHELHLHLHTHKWLLQLRWWCWSWWSPRHHKRQKSFLSTRVHIWRLQHLCAWKWVRYMLLVHTGRGHDRHVGDRQLCPWRDVPSLIPLATVGEVCRHKLLSCGIPGHSVLNPRNQRKNAGSRLVGWDRWWN